MPGCSPTLLGSLAFATGRHSNPTAHMRSPNFSTRVARWAPAAAALAGLSLLSGCFWLDGPQSSFDPSGPVAREQLDLFYLT